jgi:hypothetical protein
MNFSACTNCHDLRIRDAQLYFSSQAQKLSKIIVMMIMNDIFYLYIVVSRDLSRDLDLDLKIEMKVTKGITGQIV